MQLRALGAIMVQVHCEPFATVPRERKHVLLVLSSEHRANLGRMAQMEEGTKIHGFDDKPSKATPSLLGKRTRDSCDAENTVLVTSMDEIDQLCQILLQEEKGKGCDDSLSMMDLDTLLRDIGMQDGDVSVVDSSTNPPVCIKKEEGEEGDSTEPAVAPTRRRRNDGRMTRSTTRPARMSIRYGVSTRSWMNKKLRTTMTLLRELGIRTGLHFLLSAAAPNYAPLVFYNGSVREHLQNTTRVWEQYDRARQQYREYTRGAIERPVQFEAFPAARVHNLCVYDHADLRSKRPTQWNDLGEWPAISFVSRGERGQVYVDTEGRDPDVTCEKDPFFELTIKQGVMSEPPKEKRSWVGGSRRRKRNALNANGVMVVGGTVSGVCSTDSNSNPNTENHQETTQQQQLLPTAAEVMGDGVGIKTEESGDANNPCTNDGVTDIPESNSTESSVSTQDPQETTSMPLSEQTTTASTTDNQQPDTPKRTRRKRSDAGVARVKHVFCCKCHPTTEDGKESVYRPRSQRRSSSGVRRPRSVRPPVTSDCAQDSSESATNTDTLSTMDAPTNPDTLPSDSAMEVSVDGGESTTQEQEEGGVLTDSLSSSNYSLTQQQYTPNSYFAGSYDGGMAENNAHPLMEYPPEAYVQLEDGTYVLPFAMDNNNGYDVTPASDINYNASSHYQYGTLASSAPADLHRSKTPTRRRKSNNNGVVVDRSGEIRGSRGGTVSARRRRERERCNSGMYNIYGVRIQGSSLLYM